MLVLKYFIFEVLFNINYYQYKYQSAYLYVSRYSLGICTLYLVFNNYFGTSQVLWYLILKVPSRNTYFWDFKCFPVKYLYLNLRIFQILCPALFTFQYNKKRGYILTSLELQLDRKTSGPFVTWEKAYDFILRIFIKYNLNTTCLSWGSKEVPWD